MVEQAQRRVPPLPSLEWLTGLPPATRFAFHGGAAARAALQTNQERSFARPSGLVVRAMARSSTHTHYVAGILEIGPAQAKLYPSVPEALAAETAGAAVAVAAGFVSGWVKCVP